LCGWSCDSRAPPLNLNNACDDYMCCTQNSVKKLLNDTNVCLMVTKPPGMALTSVTEQNENLSTAGSDCKDECFDRASEHVDKVRSMHDNDNNTNQFWLLSCLQLQRMDNLLGNRFCLHTSFVPFLKRFGRQDSMCSTKQLRGELSPGSDQVRLRSTCCVTLHAATVLNYGTLATS